MDESVANIYFLQAMTNGFLETKVFVVRLWRERRDNPMALDVWRGSLENVLSGRLSYFQTLEELAADLSEQSGGFPRGES